MTITGLTVRNDVVDKYRVVGQNLLDCTLKRGGRIAQNEGRNPLLVEAAMDNECGLLLMRRVNWYLQKPDAKSNVEKNPPTVTTKHSLQGIAKLE